MLLIDIDGISKCNGTTYINSLKWSLYAVDSIYLKWCAYSLLQIPMVGGSPSSIVKDERTHTSTHVKIIKLIEQSIFQQILQQNGEAFPHLLLHFCLVQRAKNLSDAFQNIWGPYCKQCFSQCVFADTCQADHTSIGVSQSHTDNSRITAQAEN